MQQPYENTPPTAISSTGIFTVRPSRLARRDISRIVNRYWWCAAFPVAALLIAGIADWRWIIVALAVIFLLIPTAAMFAWFTIISRTAVVRQIHPHRVLLFPEGTIVVEYYPGENNDTTKTDATSNSTTTPQTPASQVYTRHNINGIQLEGDQLIIAYSHSAKRNDITKKNYGEILIPIESFPSQSEAIAFFNTAISFTTA